MVFGTIRGEGVSLCCRSDGPPAGRCLLFMHADLGRQTQWDQAFSAFARTRRVLSFDRRGHGASSGPGQGGFGYQHEHDDLLAVLDAFDVQSAVCIAHSGAAAVAYGAALFAPHRFDGLFLLDPVQSAEAVPADQARALVEQVRADPYGAAGQFYGSIAGKRPETVEQVLGDLQRTDSRTIVGMIEALGNFRPHRLDHFAIRSLIVQQRKNDGPLSIGQLGKIRHLEVENSGHWLQLDHPRMVNRWIGRFLEGLETGPAAASNADD